MRTLTQQVWNYIHYKHLEWYENDRLRIAKDMCFILCLVISFLSNVDCGKIGDGLGLSSHDGWCYKA
jgi:hypothetical protein